MRRKLNLPIDRFLILAVIRFNPQKNIRAMLEIAQKFSDDKKFMFIIIGDGEEKSEIENRIIDEKIPIPLVNISNKSGNLPGTKS